MAGDIAGMGRGGFVEIHDLRTEDQKKTAEQIVARVEADGLQAIRFAFADQHGILRGKTVMASALSSALSSGVTMTTTLLAKDTSHRTVFPVWQKGAGFGLEEMEGAGDFIMVADPATFRVLPWAPETGWVLCDIYFSTGQPVPFSTRRIFSDALETLAGQGHRYMAGLEVEFHVMKLEDPALCPSQAGQPAEPPEVSLIAHGFQYLTESRADEIDPVMEILRRDLLALGLPLRTIEVEFGPSQVEFTFNPAEGMEAADLMILFRSAVKQICHRHGYHATFMCRPGLPNLFSSGWHLHQSLCDSETGENLFVPASDEGSALSALGRCFAGGILARAAETSIFTTPTINGYKRYRPFTLAPDRAVWGNDNKGAMVRAIGGAGDPGSRIENRIGEPAANPYLYMASQILCGLDGIRNNIDPGDPTHAPYDTDAEPLPRSLIDAVNAFRNSAFYREQLGDQFVDYLTTIKEAEISRFLSEVTDWEHKEYFEIF